MSPSEAGEPAAPVPANPWLIAVVVALAAFMEILDTSIANVALPYMAGDLGVSNDESTWVLTSYLVSNAIVLPVSGWIAGVLGRKRLFMACIGFFTLSRLWHRTKPGVSSCFASCRAGRRRTPTDGAGDPGRRFRHSNAVWFRLYGITAVVAPTIGPVLGGDHVQLPWR
jgi:DHA2 family multidrug resistance protein